MKQISFLIIGWILIFSLPQTTHGQTTVAFEHLMQSYAERSANALSPDSFFVDLQNLQRELPRTTDTVQRAVLHALLTDLYGRYIHHKWFSLQQITPVVDEDTLIHDMRQWTLAQYQDALRFHGSEALKDTAALLSSTTAKYPALIKQGTGSVYYHHDMYHLLVQIVTSALEHPSFDDYSESIRQIRNTQREVYRRRNNRSALALDTLERLREKEYAKTTNDISQEYDWLLQTYGKLPVGIEIYIGYIRYLANDYPIERTNRYLRALKLCDEAAVRYPRTDRLSEVRYYREKILLPSFFATVSGIYPDSLMKISVTSRNITRLRATIMRGSYEIIKRDYQIISPVNVNRIDTILELRTPGVGLYTLKLENINDGEPTKNVQPLRVTRLALLWNALPKKKGEAIVTDAYSGKPMKASILVNGKSYPTDDEGRATFQIEERAFIKAICENDTAMEEQRIWPQAERTSTTGTLRGTLFTDRFLYRPGQLVQVKGVLYRQRGDSTRVATDVSDTLMLRDNFGKTIATRQVTTNEFGSFVTEFTLPANGVNGIYRIYYDQQIQTYIRVEAYKRPTFEISIDKPKGAYRLGDSIVLTGQVKTFSGIPLAHATVRYRLRSTHHRPYQFIPQDFEVGEVVADGNGNYAIPLRPNQGTEELRDYFQYHIFVDVTNYTGETQHTQVSFSAGTSPVHLEFIADSQLCREYSPTAVASAHSYIGDTINVGVEMLLYKKSDAEAPIREKPNYRINVRSNRELDLTDVWKDIPYGTYHLILRAGQDTTYHQTIEWFSIQDKRVPTTDFLWAYQPQRQFDAHTPAMLYVGTAAKDTYIYYDVYAKGEKIDSQLLNVSDGKMSFSYSGGEEYGDAFTVLVSAVKNLSARSHTFSFARKKKNRSLSMKWSVFRDRLQPGQAEEWRLTVKDAQGKRPVDAELLAIMYDASLDKIWSGEQMFQYYDDWIRPVSTRYEHLPNDLGYSYVRKFAGSSFPLSFDKFIVWMNYNGYIQTRLVRDTSLRNKAASPGEVTVSEEYADVGDVEENSIEHDVASTPNLPELIPTFRTNFNETAFFYPQLRTNAEGEAVISFTVPESLTAWNVHTYAHTKDFRFGRLDSIAVTYKDFMLMPNLPRFVREGDNTYLNALLTNRTAVPQNGEVTLTIFDPATEQVIYTETQPFHVDAGQDSGVSFRFVATDEYELLGCRMVASGDSFSDGEQHLLPVLSNRQEVTESVVMPIRGKQKRTFSLASLYNNNSPTATRRQMSVEFTANPVVYAVQALHELAIPDNEQSTVTWAAVYYANMLGAYIARNYPDLIKTSFNPDEAERNADVALQKLQQLQQSDGRWTWFEGMRGSDYITQYVLMTLVRLYHLTDTPAPADISLMIQRGMTAIYKNLPKEYDRDRSSVYLYLRTMSRLPIPNEEQRVYNAHLERLDTIHDITSVRQAAQIAYVLSRNGKQSSAERIATALKRAAVNTEEMGMYYDKIRDPYSWFNLAVPTQVAVIELMDAIGDYATADELKLWLLKQKQTRRWDSPVSTVDAVYALLLQGNNFLANTGKVTIKIGRKTFETKISSADGLSYLHESVTDVRTLRRPQTAKVTNKSNSPAWGAVYAQYEEELSQIAERGSGLTIEKNIYLERTNSDGHVGLLPISTSSRPQVGDVLVHRLVITGDRAMDFIRIRDHRAACLEPLALLSGYTRAGNLGLYQSIQDTYTDCFIDYLPKGTFVLEFRYRVSRAGSYEGGIASIESVYAPEFRGHSRSVKVQIEE